MGTTASGLRYPTYTAQPNPVQDIQNLATDVDTYTVQKVATKAARTALTGVNVGRIVVETDTGATYVRGPSGWIFLGANPNTQRVDTTATTPGTTGITAATGWTLSTRFIQSMGNGMAYVSCRVQPTSTAVTVPADGNITNGPVFTVPTGWAPIGESRLGNASTGRLAAGLLGTDRIAIISAVAPGATLAVGEVVELAGYYMLADPSAVLT